MRKSVGIRSAIAVLLATALATPALAGGDWNDAEIDWKGYEEGLALAKNTSKPVCLVFYTDWCPHCTRYSTVFHDDKIVEASKKLVMVRLNKDQNAEISKLYAPDGEYIPRTYFLSPEGVLDPEIHERRANYLYFYDEVNPTGLLRGMEEAVTKPAGFKPEE